MTIHILFTGCLILITIGNYLVGRRNVLYPAFVFSLLWATVLTLYIVPLVEVDNLGTDTLAIVVGGVLAFSLGAAVVRWWGYSRPVDESDQGSPFWKKAIYSLCLGMLPAFYFEIQRLSLGGSLEGFIISARTAIVDAVMNGEKPYSSPFYTAAPMVAQYLAFIFLIEARKGSKEKKWLWASILLAVSYSVLTTGRTWLLALLVGLVGIHILKSKQLSARTAWKFVRWPVITFLVIFSVLAFFNKDTSSENNAETLGHYVFGYAIIPLAGFNYVVHHPSEYKEDPNHTFTELIGPIARMTGSRYSPPATLGEFVLVPLPTNVCTIFRYYYVDFGFFGMLLTLFVIGAGQTWLFRKAGSGDQFFIFLFAISLYPLVMSVFDELYSIIHIYLIAAVFGFLYFRVLRTIPLRLDRRTLAHS